jgi:capsular exopolysaccharide synthesis family protein
VLLRDAVDNKIKDAEDVERRLHLEVLAAIPRYKDEDDEIAREAYQGLRTALLFSRRKGHGQVVLITGAAPGEGKTTTLLQLGRRLADAGERTLLVDCDLRKAHLHTRLDVPREPGFTDYFLRPVEVKSLVRPTGFAHLSLIPVGALPPNPPALLAREELEAAFDLLRREFQWILVDSPPVAAVTDALLLARQADSTVLVVQQNRVDRTVVRRAIASLRKVTPHLLGAVLNAVDVRSKRYYGYGYDYASHKDGPAGPGAQTGIGPLAGEREPSDGL